MSLWERLALIVMLGLIAGALIGISFNVAVIAHHIEMMQ
jgi:hypothetical protein